MAKMISRLTIVNPEGRAILETGEVEKVDIAGPLAPACKCSQDQVHDGSHHDLRCLLFQVPKRHDISGPLVLRYLPVIVNGDVPL